MADTALANTAFANIVYLADYPQHQEQVIDWIIWKRLFACRYHARKTR
ncbi:hypothetical protein N6P31_11085 [Pectobacterium betavasculorum]|nr:hypothetical protein [Pectobacterium betavasculorum]